MTIREKITIAQNFADLRETGIRCLEALSGKVWTDFNSHDPGITILESVVYAMTEIELRTSLPDEDLFLSENPLFAPFVVPSFALACEPVLDADWQKSVADLEGISRSWLAENPLNAPALYLDNLTTKAINLNGGELLKSKGLFDVFVELSSSELPIANDFSDLELNGNILRSTTSAVFLLPDGSFESYFVEFALPFGESFPEDWHDENIILNSVAIPGGITYNSANDVFTASIQVTYNATEIFQCGVVIKFTPHYTQNTLINTLNIFVQTVLSDTSNAGLLKRLNHKVASINNMLLKTKALVEHKRMLGTVFNPPRAARLQEIVIQADIQIAQATDYEALVSSIFIQIEQLLSPVLASFSEAELTQKGYSLEQIFDGPQLLNGFLLTEGLIVQQEKQTLYASDFIHAILDSQEFSGAIKLLSFAFSCFINNYLVSGPSNNCLNLSNSSTYRPRLSVVKSRIRLFREGGVEEIRYDKNSVLDQFQKANVNSIKRIKLDHNKVLGGNGISNESNTNDYYSIQNDFPTIYGIGHGTLAQNTSSVRLAQSQQLKAYLLMFEHFLASSIQQTENIASIYSLNPKLLAVQSIGNLLNVPNIELLLEGFLTAGINWDTYKDDANNSFLKFVRSGVETDEQFFARRNRYLDHLLARFGEDLSDYSTLMLAKGFYDAPIVIPGLLNVALMLAKGFYDTNPFYLNPTLKATAWRVLKDKLYFLSNAGEIEKNRGRGVDFSKFIRIKESSPAQWQWFIFDPIDDQDLMGAQNFFPTALSCFNDLLATLPLLQEKNHYVISGIAPNFTVNFLANPPSGIILAKLDGIFPIALTAKNRIEEVIQLVTQIWDTYNVSGLETKVGAMLGWGANTRRDLVNLKLTEQFSIEFNGANFAFTISDEDLLIYPLHSAFIYISIADAEIAAQKAVSAGIFSTNYKPSIIGGNTVLTLNDSGGLLATIEIPTSVNIDINELIGKWAIFLHQKFASQEGFYLVEHSQLLPRSKNAALLSQQKFSANINPYEYQISIVVPSGKDPGLTTSVGMNRLQDLDFRVLLEKRLQGECMAHILPYFIYPNDLQFGVFQQLFKRWHVWKRLSATSALELEPVQNELINWLNLSNPQLPVYIN